MKTQDPKGAFSAKPGRFLLWRAG